MKASRVYKYKTNKNAHFESQSPRLSRTVFWDSKTRGTYVRGMEGKTLLKKLNPFNRMTK